MLKISDIQETKKVPKTLNPGNHKAKINSIVLTQGYNLGSYNLVLNVEGIDQGADFEGFLVDVNNPNGPRYKGQIGKVRMSQYSYQDGTTPTGIVINRDRSIASALINLSKALGKYEEFSKVEGDTIEEVVQKASTILSGDTFLNFCFAGKEYEGKTGYKNFDLFLPNSRNGQYAYEALSASPSKLIQFDASQHILAIKTKTVESFEPAQSSAGDDFDL